MLVRGQKNESAPEKKRSRKPSSIPNSLRSSQCQRRRPDSATRAKGRAKVSWQATDAVLHLFDRKDKASEFIMLFAIAHHYNDNESIDTLMTDALL